MALFQKDGFAVKALRVLVDGIVGVNDNAQALQVGADIAV